MTENGQGYVQVVRGPDGEPIALIRLSDLTALLELARPGGTAADAMPPLGDDPTGYLDQALLPDSAAGNTELSEFGKRIQKVLQDVIEARNDNWVRPAHSEEDVTDITAVREVREALARSEERLIPSAIADRLIDGESPLRVWRNARGLTQAALAKKAGMSQAMISGIERGTRTGDVKTLKSLAEALDLKVDDLID